MTVLVGSGGFQSDSAFMARQFGANLLVAVVMTLVMTTLIFHGRATVPLWGIGNLAFDLIPSTLLPCIAATFGISKVTGLAIGQGVIQPIGASRFAVLPQNDLLAGLALGIALLALLGTGFVAALAYGYDGQPVPYHAIMIAKLGYALILCLANTPIIVARARSRSWQGANDGLSGRT